MPKLAHLLHPAAAPTLAELASGQPCIDSLEALIQCVSGGRAALPMDAEVCLHTVNEFILSWCWCCDSTLAFAGP